MSIFIITFVVCLIVTVGTVAMLMMSRTPRFRTDYSDIARVLDQAISGEINENEWHSVIGYPIRHDEYLESLRRRCQGIFDNHARPWQLAQGGALFSRAGRDELNVLLGHLRARTGVAETRA
ncbi:hypothetical protein F8A90_05610 [Cobetia sp. cqz5-12]|uniref:hypothetical protein n=1 Tax=unclassified Cobetia TaxID=2609414 RepID=UPI00140CF43E|nr:MULTISPECIES: hypothetical protein [unclassified Cobetia]NHH86665.1 hypothetical protein [Cobetia sp. MB87]QQK63659.1 hypothetical protein F8A90_05610 [Cobetia sp. cqz5-12]